MMEFVWLKKVGAHEGGNMHVCKAFIKKKKKKEKCPIVSVLLTKSFELSLESGLCFFSKLTDKCCLLVAGCGAGAACGFGGEEFGSNSDTSGTLNWPNACAR